MHEIKIFLKYQNDNTIFVYFLFKRVLVKTLLLGRTKNMLTRKSISLKIESHLLQFKYNNT